jgi:WD40 repeat protein/Ni2+-binding GTPase involved in maturation of urease and hydrogenase
VRGVDHVGGVFINYRTGDGEFAATLITRVLMARFGAEHVFLASRSIRPGEDFAQKILERLRQCDVLLAVIGSRWQSITDRQRRREAGSTDDWVHREIAEAFRHGLRVIPVFLDHTVGLSELELPPDLAPLARCQFLRLSHRNDTRDLARLVDELSDLVPGLVLNRVFATTTGPTANLEPSAWLRAEYQMVPFDGRETELAGLAAWAGAPKPVSAHLITGPAGQGKTRLAQQLCQDMTANGWVAGAVHDNAAIADLTNLSKTGSPLLVVVDNAETRFEQIRTLAAALTERSPTSPPARLLLLSRGTGEWLRRLRTDTDDRVGPLFRAIDEHPLAPLATTVHERRKEFHRAAAAYTDYLHLPDGRPTEPSDLDNPRYASVCTIHATALVTVLATAHGSVPAPDPDLYRAARPECPYRGLQPFQEQDARFFRGRDPQIRQLSALIEQHRIVMVTGASGSGKSSLVRAGVFPLLRQYDIALVTFRPTEGADAHALLARALASALGHEPDTRDVSLLADAIVESVGHLVLFVDQFEELVASDPDTARELLRLVAALVRAAPPRPATTPALRAVFTGRSADLDDVLTADLTPMPHTMTLPRMGPAELKAAITGPADLPLVSFEPGLVDRIVADAMDSPGQLPLVEFALTRLWESQQGGTLTHRMYDEQGGVAGALASYAQEVYERHLVPDEQKLAERLLVQLARPGDSGSFILTPARIDQLDPASRVLARTLAQHRLVVLRHDPGQSEVVALAHEALVQQWPLLRDWLLAARDFRSWQEQLRIALGQWHQANRDHGSLLRGAPLATAQDWLAKHPSGFTDDERAYITTSETHQRRGVRRWRTITTLIAVLALVATASAALAFKRNEELADQLHRTAAATLAQEASRRADTNPLAALQFAQAAWHHDPHRPEAYAALLQQHLKYIGVEEIRSGLWSGAVNRVATTADGGVIAVSEEDGKITVWTGLLGPAPERWFVATDPTHRSLLLSPDGRWLAVEGDKGGVTLWDISQRSTQLPLRPPDLPGSEETVQVRSARFAPDGQELVLTLQRNKRSDTTGPTNTVEVWDVTQRQQPVATLNPASGLTDLQVRRIEPDARSAWFAEYRPDGSHRNILRDLTTGAVVRETPAAFITRNDLFVDCQKDQIAVLDPASGAVQMTRPVLQCPEPDGLTDLSGRYAMVGSRSGENSFLQLDLVDVLTGQSYSLPAPAQRQVNGTENFLAVPQESGPPAVFVLGTGALLRLRPPTPVDPIAQPNLSARPAATALSPDGRILVTLTEESPAGTFGLSAMDVTTGRRIAAVANKLVVGAHPRTKFSPDGKQLLVAGDSGALIQLLASDFTVVRKIMVESYSQVATAPVSIVPISEDVVAVLRDGDITAWRMTTGEMTDTPQYQVVANDRPEPGDQITAIPWHLPEHLVTTSTTGVQLWNLGTGQLVKTFLPRPGHLAPAIVAEPGGPRIAVHYRDAGQLQIWHTEQEDDRSEIIPVPGDQSVVAFTGDNRLITVSGQGGVHVWDLGAGVHIAELNAPNSPVGWSMHENILTAATGQGPLTIDMDPRHWIEHLCRINDRDYTAEESAVLPPGADHSPPCGSG